MKRLLTFLPIIFSLIGCQSSSEATNKVSYESKYEYIVEIPGVDKNTIYDSIPLWLSSEFPEDDINSNDKAKNFAQTFMAFDSPGWANTLIVHKQQNIKNVTVNNRDSGIFTCSIKNVVLETQNEKWGAGGRWLVTNADIMIQIKDEKYKILWENVSINKLKIGFYGRNTWVKNQTTIEEKIYGKLIATLENASHNLKNYVEKINNNDW